MREKGTATAITTEDTEGTENRGGSLRDQLSHAVIGAAVSVHRALGPGLLESVYATCMEYELAKRRIPFDRQVNLPVRYDGQRMDARFQLDLLIAGELVVEPKSVDLLLDLHRAQLITYLKLSGTRKGLLSNFNVLKLTNGVIRLVV